MMVIVQVFLALLIMYKDLGLPFVHRITSVLDNDMVLLHNRGVYI